MASGRFLKRQLSGILAAVFFHLMIWLILRPPPEQIPESRIQTSIRFLVSKDPLPRLDASKKVRKKSLQLSKQSTDANGSVALKSEVGRGQTYGQLLPNLESLPFTVDGAGKSAKQESEVFSKALKKPPEQQLPVDRFVSKIKLPLRWRSRAKESRAVLRLFIDDQDSLWIRSLYGDPLLRASLYEALRDLETRIVLMALMKSEGRHEFALVLKFLQENESYKGLNAEAVAYAEGIEIIRRLPPPMRKFPGMPLSDSHSKHADLVQSLEIQKLMESPAFARIITDEVL